MLYFHLVEQCVYMMDKQWHCSSVTPICLWFKKPLTVTPVYYINKS